MDDAYLVEIAVVVILTSIVAILRAAEVALDNVLKTPLKERAEDGDERAAIALELVDAPTTMLTALHIVSTFILLLLGVHTGATLVEDAGLIAEGLGEWGYLFGFVAAILTLSLFVLLVGEIIPERIALSYPEQTARLLAPSLKWLAVFFAPFSRMLEYLAHLMFRLVGAECESSDIVTEAEVKEMIREGTDHGVFEQVEEQMVNKVLKLGDKTAAALMTPRNDVVWLDETRDMRELLNEAYESGHSNFVVAKETLDVVLGIVSIGDLSRFVLLGGSGTLHDILREPLVLQNNLSALKVLELMREAKRRIALVVDEYGGFDGIITTHDLIEAVVGELSDEDEDEASIIERSDHSYLIDAAMDVDEVLERFGIESPRDEEKRGYHSLGGFVLSQLGHIPQAGEHFVYESHCFEVIDMDRNRIDKILVRKVPSEVPESSAA